MIPESMGMDVKELSAMVQQVNQTEVSTEDRLSDHVQHYDSKEAVMEKKRQKQKLQRRVFMIALEKRNSRALRRKQRKLWRRP